VSTLLAVLSISFTAAGMARVFVAARQGWLRPRTGLALFIPGALLLVAVGVLWRDWVDYGVGACALAWYVWQWWRDGGDDDWRRRRRRLVSWARSHIPRPVVVLPRIVTT